MQFNRREFLRALAVVALIWVAFLFVLARWQKSAPQAGGRTEPQLIHYPGTEGVPEQTSLNLGYRKYWFTLDEDYPSKSVYYFYKNQLEPKGWQALTSADPDWVHRNMGNEGRDLFQATWLSPDRLFELTVDMMSVSRQVDKKDPSLGQTRDPGIQVFVTQRRSLNPAAVMQPREPEPTDPAGVQPGQ